MILRAPGPDPIILGPVRASAAEEAWYRRQLIQLVDGMCKESQRELVAAYRAYRSTLIMDASLPN